MREIDALVSEYQHEKHRPRESEALLILRKVASLVKPIMRRRDWRVGTLCEFYPHERNLLGLNVNAGQKICLRLRYAGDERQFLPIEQVVDTMLHELCHIVHGPHNQQFHALWNQLRDEHEELVHKGYTGEGFLSEGRRLGGRKIPLDEARRQARAAAEQRRMLSAGSGRKLGGTPTLRGTDMRRVIADAAQRRIEVTRGCASGTEAGDKLAEEASRNGFWTKAEEDDANEQAILQAYIELIEEEEREKYGSSYIPPSQQNPAGSRSQLPSEPIDLIADNNNGDNNSYDQLWTCPTCTLENPANFLCCDACTAERPIPRNSKRGTEVPIPESSSSSSSQQTSSQPTKNGNNKRPAPEPPAATTQTQPRPRNNNTQATPKTRPRPPATQSLASLDREVQKRPLGWVCHGCGTFMETEWWTCSFCGRMKLVS